MCALTLAASESGFLARTEALAFLRTLIPTFSVLESELVMYIICVTTRFISPGNEGLRASVPARSLLVAQ